MEWLGALIQTIKDNPVPTVLIALGFWGLDRRTVGIAQAVKDLTKSVEGLKGARGGR